MNEKRKTGNSYLRFVLIILVSAAAGDALGSGFLFTCIVFCICGIYEGFWQMRYVKTIQIAHPYMKGDPSERNFQKKWLESCDEAEREMIYQSSYKAYMTLNKCIPVLLVVTMLSHLFFQTGIMAVLAVAAIWLLVSLTYTGSCVSTKRKKRGENRAVSFLKYICLSLMLIYCEPAEIWPVLSAAWFFW